MNVVLAFCLALSLSGYITGAPVPNWLGLATADGRDAIQLGENCEGVVAGVNVVLLDDGDLQVVDPFVGLRPEECVVITHVHMSDVPCARNPDGVCDVAFS